MNINVLVMGVCVCLLCVWWLDCTGFRHPPSRCLQILLATRKNPSRPLLSWKRVKQIQTVCLEVNVQHNRDTKWYQVLFLSQSRNSLKVGQANLANSSHNARNDEHMWTTRWNEIYRMIVICGDTKMFSLLSEWLLIRQVSGVRSRNIQRCDAKSVDARCLRVFHCLGVSDCDQWHKQISVQLRLIETCHAALAQLHVWWSCIDKKIMNIIVIFAGFHTTWGSAIKNKLNIYYPGVRNRHSLPVQTSNA